ncbi:MAG: hypothetical protein ABJA98_33600 [Acidobacteriota bacterium]
MMRRTYCGRILWMVVLLTACASSRASAQADLTGSWNGFFHEDQPERIPGPSLGDYLGLPINDSARAFAEAWDASRLTIPEHQCRAHSSPYILRGPLNMRLWEERDPQTQQIIAIHQDISNFQQRRTFWMDGRPHPSEYAEHTWMGFSTARWEGDTLVVTTTHIKQMWHRRNGIPQSDRVALTERYIRHGNVLTLITVTDDPTYLTEPLVKSTNMLLNPRPLTPEQLLYPCQSVVEIASQPRGAVPHYLPGENPFLGEFRQQSHLPAIATRGGKETMYPEFQVTLKAASQGASPR